jgi:asparagine synthase (glutamine-hydrolysing)
MCGIAGILRADGEPVPPGLVDAMVAVLRHRGPDGEGTYFGTGVGFGQTRLAIIDLSPASDQPFVDAAAGLSLIFNGEIYNYIELRDELKALGHTFRSAGDTEVLLRAYEQWGLDALPRLNGMFAFALWDEKKRRLLLARDRFGEKPLFIARSTRGVIFASEMKAIFAIRPELREPNRKAIYRYLARGDLDLDCETFFSGIQHLPGGHYLLLDERGQGAPVRYWAPSAAEVPTGRRAAVERFRELMFDSVRLRLRSDVPVGSSLSGGIDSSSIVSTINAQKTSQWVQQKTFSARFHSKAHDEGPFIEIVTRKVDAESHEVWVDPGKFIEAFERLQYHQEEPIASASPFAQWLVMELAKEHSTTVLLDGQGADEILGGYDQAHGMFLAHWLRRGRVDKMARELASYGRRYHGIREPAMYAAYYSLPGRLRDGLAERYYRASGVVAPELHREFAPAYATAPTPFGDRLRNELVRWQTTTQLPEFLRYADRNSMAFSREVRLPFLDHRLVDYCFGLPPDLLLKGATTKVVLREAMRGIVPDEILDRKDKLAYAPPQHEWNHSALKPWMITMLDRALGRPELFNAEQVAGIKAQFEAGSADTLAWRIASTEAWYGLMIESPGAVAAGHAEISPISW